MTDTLTEGLAVETMPIELIRPAADNPRDSLGELTELTDSIEALGILQPLIVQGTGELGADDAEIMVVIAGHRRLAAAALAELTHVPVIVRNDIDEQGRQAAMLIENFHRLDLGPIERARALQQLADAGVPQKEIGKAVGIHQGTVSKWLALLKLPEKAQKWVAAGKLTQEDAVELSKLPAEDVVGLCKDSGPPDKWAIGQRRRDLEQQKKRDAAIKEASDKGWPVLESDPEFWPQLGLEGDNDPVMLDKDRAYPEGLLAHVDPDEHGTESCHAVYIDVNGRVVPACTDPSRHPKPEGWKSDGDLADEKEQAEIAEALERGEQPKVDGREATAYEIRMAKRTQAEQTVQPKIDPVRVASMEVVAAQDFTGAVADYVATVLIEDEDTFNFTWARVLLDLPEPRMGYSGEDVVAAVRADGAISGTRAVLAWGLGLGLRDLEELAISVVAGEDIEEGFVQASRALLDALGVMTYEAFVASLMELDETDAETDDAGPSVEVFEERGKYKRRCSECGVLDGVNTKEDLAQTRANQHLKEAHKIEAAA